MFIADANARSIYEQTPRASIKKNISSIAGPKVSTDNIITCNSIPISTVKVSDTSRLAVSSLSFKPKQNYGICLIAILSHHGQP